MTAQTMDPARAAAPAIRRPNRLAVGTMVWLSSELMFFAGLFAMYFTLRAQVPEVWATETAELAVPFATVNTAILVLSSFTCQAGVKKAESFQPHRTGGLLSVGKWGMVEWFTLTYILGAVFIAGQMYEYTELVHHGITISSNPFGSVFYLTTGFHAIHVFGGLIAFLLILARAFAAKRFGHHEASSAMAVSYYWHFVDVVWVALYFIIYWLDTIAPVAF